MFWHNKKATGTWTSIVLSFRTPVEAAFWGWTVARQAAGLPPASLDDQFKVLVFGGRTRQYAQNQFAVIAQIDDQILRVHQR